MLRTRWPTLHKRDRSQTNSRAQRAAMQGHWVPVVHSQSRREPRYITQGESEITAGISGEGADAPLGARQAAISRRPTFVSKALPPLAKHSRESELRRCRISGHPQVSEDH